MDHVRKRADKPDKPHRDTECCPQPTEQRARKGLDRTLATLASVHDREDDATYDRHKPHPARPAPAIVQPLDVDRTDADRDKNTPYNKAQTVVNDRPSAVLNDLFEKRQFC